MTRLFRATLALLILTAAPLMLVRLFGNGLWHAPVASLFLNPDGTRCTAPCILGIRPGETGAQEVASALSAHPSAATTRAVETLKNTYLFTADGNAMSLAFSVESGGEINYVRISFIERPELRKTRGPTLGDVIQAFGAPDYIIDCSAPAINCTCGLILIFLDAGLEVFLPDPSLKRLEPANQPSDIVALRLRVCPESAMDIPTRPWNGFTKMSPQPQETEIRLFYQTTDRLFPMVCQTPQGVM
jgi:hypothetical protein